MIEALLRQRYEGWEGVGQLEGSGERLSKFFEEMCLPFLEITEGLDKCLKAVYKDSYDEMLVSGPTLVWTLCPHHLLPCKFKVYVGYIPKGKVLGLSKFSRIAILLGKRPIMQEMYSRELAGFLWEHLEPEGVGVYVIGRHGCMEVRGVRQGVDVNTSVLLGSFKADSAVRKEFYDVVRSKSNGNF